MQVWSKEKISESVLIITPCEIASGTPNDIWEIPIFSELRFVILLETIQTEM